jgi:hypothetical protein
MTAARRASRDLADLSRLLLPTERSDITVTWRRNSDAFVLSLWHDDVCVGSAMLSPRDAAEMSAFLVRHLGDRAVWGPRLVVSEGRTAPMGWIARVVNRAKTLRLFRGGSRTGH